MSTPQEGSFEYAGEEEEPEPAQSTEPEGQGEEPEPDLGTVQAERDALKARYEESSKEGRRLHEVNRQSAERERQLMSLLESQRAQPQGPDPSDRYRQALSASGIPEEALPALEAMIEEKAGALATVKAQEQMAPLFQAMQAQTDIKQELGDYDDKEVYTFLQDNPHEKARYDERLTRDPVGAMATVLLKMNTQRTMDSEAGMHAEHEEAEAVKQSARRDARVTGSRRSAPREPQKSLETDLGDLAALSEHGKETRNYAPYVQKRLSMVPSMSRINWPDEG